MKAHTQSKRTVLAVDDDEVNLMILAKTAQDAGYDVKPFGSGQEAWDYLMHHPDSVDIALLDKMMPGLGGMELLGYIKRHKTLKFMPVIFQTGDVGMAQIREALESGVYYYLTKPFHPEILISILHAASNECALREELLAQMAANQGAFLTMLNEGEFFVDTHAKARLMAASLAQVTAKPEFVARGLMELLVNAIEHGNLEVGYATKRKCLLNKQWREELIRRVSRPEYKNRTVKVEIQRIMSSLHLIITDQGKGFEWRDYMTADARGALNEPSGRGIAIAKNVLDELHYSGKGNQVHCTIHVAMDTVGHTSGSKHMASSMALMNPGPRA